MMTRAERFYGMAHAALQRAREYRQSGDLAAAQGRMGQALELWKRAGDAVARARAYRTIARQERAGVALPAIRGVQ